MYLFIPKLLFPSLMGHTLLGISKSGSLLPTSSELIGFVDVSMQPNSGTIEALSHRPLFLREWSGEPLSPYLCNLLISSSHRKNGYGRALVQAAVSEAASWGQKDIFLHVETDSIVALRLYISEDFKVVRQLDDGKLLHMGKPCVREATRRRSGVGRYL